MTNYLANPKLVAAAGILFTIATIFNSHNQTTPTPLLGVSVQQQAAPVRTGITPGELPMCPPEGSCPIS